MSGYYNYWRLLFRMRSQVFFNQLSGRTKSTVARHIARTGVTVCDGATLNGTPIPEDASSGYR